MQCRSIRAVIGIVAGAAALSVVPTARSQYTANFQTNVISGVTSNWTGDYYVGNTNFSDVLLVQNSGVLSNRQGYLGFGISGSNSTLYVGYQGYNNSLVVADGSVLATTLIVGFFPSDGCDNLLQLDSGSVIVTDATHDATLEVGGGKLIFNGGLLQVDKLVITNPCASFIHAGGTLLVGSFVLDPNAFCITAVSQEGNDMRVTYLMGPGQTNALQATAGDGSGGYNANGFADIFVVTNNAFAGTVTNYLDVGAATNKPARYYRVRLVP